MMDQYDGKKFWTDADGKVRWFPVEDEGLKDPWTEHPAARDGFARAKKCRKCGVKVFYVEHNGGKVWFDDLGWPWPKHACFASDVEGEPAILRKQLSSRSSEGALLGIVYRSIDPQKRGNYAAAIRWSNGMTECAIIHGSRPIESGELVSRRVGSQFAEILCADGGAFEVRAQLKPTALGVSLGEKDIGVTCRMCFKLQSQNTLPKHVFENHMRDYTYREFFELITGYRRVGDNPVPPEYESLYASLRRKFDALCAKSLEWHEKEVDRIKHAIGREEQRHRKRMAPLLKKLEELTGRSGNR